MITSANAKRQALFVEPFTIATYLNLAEEPTHAAAICQSVKCRQASTTSGYATTVYGANQLSQGASLRTRSMERRLGSDRLETSIHAEQNL
jgi:ABC-type uncharacterized transport system permease subunit